MAGAFGGLLGIVKLSSPAVVNCDLGGKHLFKLELLQDRANVECGFLGICHKTEFGLSGQLSHGGLDAGVIIFSAACK